MGMFKKGDTVRMKFGGTATIASELGSGGQGTVYKVKYNSKDYALKWYHQKTFKDEKIAKAFYKNLENNIEKGAPNNSFLWPIAISEVCNGTFGYIMDLRKSDYFELTSLFLAKKEARFKSFEAQINACINIIQGFRELHNKGYTYQDINNGNFFYNPKDGDVLICDNDNVSPTGINLGVLGKQRYMAPEIVKGEKDPDKISDRFSMSLILFRLLFINHPLEGKYSTPPCLTKELERKYYGEAPIFIFDPTDNQNRPIPGTDKNLQIFWPIFPQYVRDMFIKAFSKDVMQLKSPRIIEQEWLNVFLKLKASIIKCPYCKEETFVDKAGENECIECGKKINVPAELKFNNINIPLYPTSKLMLWNVDSTLDDVKTQIGDVLSNPKDPTLIGIRNMSNVTWKVTLLDGSERNVENNNVVPIKKGFKIQFTTNSKIIGEII